MERRFGTLQHMGPTSERDVMQKIWDWAQETLTTEGKSNKFLISTDHKERAVWHVAANCNNQFFFREFMLVGFWLRITEAIYNKFLLATELKDKTVWQVVTERHQVELSEKLRSRLEIN